MQFLARVARPRYSPIYLFLVSLVLNAFVTFLTGVPGPETHDEFSYLLAADTFAHGRVTNPPHPLWKHFESFHILQQPTYQSKYQPGQGLILALGQVTIGLPIAGAWLSAALAAAAIAWALRPALSRRYAFLAGLVVALHPLVLLWSQNYWGGSLPALGGALVFGGALRLGRKPSPSAAGLLAVGIAILFNTRPYEGLVFTAIIVTPLLLRRNWRTPAVVATIASILVASACWTLYYNDRVTGDALKLPYVAHESQYALAPPFLWQHELPPKQYRHDSIRQYNQDVELPHYRRQRTPLGFLTGVIDKLNILAKSYGPEPIVLAGLIVLPYAVYRHPRLRRPTLLFALFIGALMLSNWTFPHYAAPSLVLLIYLGMASLRPLVVRRPALLYILLVASVATAGYWTVDRVATYPQSFGRTRQALLAELLANPGGDLVIVRYAPGRNINTEWVYNPADIDHAPVVFAQDMGDAKNRDLFNYFAGRTFWLLEVGPEGTRIRPYPMSG